MTVQAKQVQQTQSDKQRLLRSLPQGTNRVQVLTAQGKTRFKKPDEVGPTDQIMINSAGAPVVMMGKPGRKAKVDLAPLNENIGEVMEARSEHVETHQLVEAVQDNSESDAVIEHILASMAAEAAALEFERMEGERHGRDTSNISSKRARVLKGMADVWLKRKERLQAGVIDMDTPAFATLFAYTMQTVRSSMEDAGLRPEHIETVFTKLSKRLGDGWKEEAKVKMRAKA